MRATNRRLFATILTLLAGLMACLASPVSAEMPAVDIGQKFPDFKLQDTSGKEHSLSQYAGKIVVLEFCSQECPWSRGADPQLIELAKKYEPKGVVVLGIDSHRATTPEEIQTYAKQTGKSYPILKDSQNQFADLVKAMRTPEVYIVGTDGTLVYHGAFDNRTRPDTAGDTNYTAQSLDALLAGQPVPMAKTAAWGCTIKRVEKAEAGSGS